MNKDIEIELKKYFEYLIQGFKSSIYQIIGPDTDYINEYIWKECIQYVKDNNKHDPTKGEELPYLKTVLRSNVLKMVTKVNKVKGFKDQILKPYYREERLNEILSDE